MTSLDNASDGVANHYVAPDYDTLADSPILAGAELSTTEFVAGGDDVEKRVLPEGQRPPEADVLLNERRDRRGHFRAIPSRVAQPHPVMLDAAGDELGGRQLGAGGIKHY